MALVVLALVSVIYLPMIQDIGASSSRVLLRWLAPVARSVLSRVDSDAATTLPQDPDFFVPKTVTQV
jgi:hypothetical protein